MPHYPGSEECPFIYPPEEGKGWSPDSPVMSHSGPQRVHSGTQTEGPQLSSAATEAASIQPSLLVPAAPSLTSCPSPVLRRKERHCAKWVNRASVAAEEPGEESKPTYESLESVSVRTSYPPCISKPQSLQISQLFCVFPRTTRGCTKLMTHYVGN